jgi:hypothetical protein
MSLATSSSDEDISEKYFSIEGCFLEF